MFDTASRRRDFEYATRVLSVYTLALISSSHEDSSLLRSNEAESMTDLIKRDRSSEHPKDWRSAILGVKSKTGYKIRMKKMERAIYRTWWSKVLLCAIYSHERPISGLSTATLNEMDHQINSLRNVEVSRSIQWN